MFTFLAELMLNRFQCEAQLANWTHKDDGKTDPCRDDAGANQDAKKQDPAGDFTDPLVLP